MALKVALTTNREPGIVDPLFAFPATPLRLLFYWSINGKISAKKAVKDSTRQGQGCPENENGEA